MDKRHHMGATNTLCITQKRLNIYIYEISRRSLSCNSKIRYFQKTFIIRLKRTQSSRFMKVSLNMWDAFIQKEWEIFVLFRKGIPRIVRKVIYTFIILYSKCNAIYLSHLKIKKRNLQRKSKNVTFKIYNVCTARGPWKHS